MLMLMPPRDGAVRYGDMPLLHCQLRRCWRRAASWLPALLMLQQRTRRYATIAFVDFRQE